MIEEQIIELWEPTQTDIDQYITDRGWPMFTDLKDSHLETQEEKDKLRTAITTVSNWIEELKAHPDNAGLSLILIANEVQGDMARTGYGCGKTTLARIAHNASHTIQWVRETKDIYLNPIGRFYEAREVMALFDKENFDQRYTFGQFGRLLVIDDVGREGNLKWEKRDPEMQAQEKRDRYYNIINHCYENSISMILTSNLTSRQLAEHVGGAAWSRLLQMCPSRYRVNMTGLKDMRPLLAETEWF